MKIKILGLFQQLALWLVHKCECDPLKWLLWEFHIWASDEWLQDAKQVYHAAHIFAFSASRKNSAVIFVSVWLANAQNLTRGDGLTDGWLVKEHASEHFLQKILTGIFCTTQELSLPKCKRHLHKISGEFNQNILLNATHNTAVESDD